MQACGIGGHGPDRATLATVQTTEQNAPEPPSPRAVLDALLEGNARLAGNAPTGPRRDPARRAALTSGQAPRAAVLGCADSRVPVELLLDQGFGDVFVIRNAGQILDRTVQASLEYAITQLGVSVVLVLGHESCGAVGAAVADLTGADPLPGAMPALVEGVRGHLDPEHPAEGAVERHVGATVAALLRDSELARAAVETGDLLVAGGVYGLEEARVRLLEDPGITGA